MTDTSARKAQLEAALTAVTTELRTLGIEDVEGDWVATPPPDAEGTLGDADPNVHADAVEDWNERRATLAPLETRFNNLTRALEKLAAGTYGRCEVCDAPIEAARLDANPAARTCVAHREEEATLPI